MRVWKERIRKRKYDDYEESLRRSKKYKDNVWQKSINMISIIGNDEDTWIKIQRGIQNPNSKHVVLKTLQAVYWTVPPENCRPGHHALPHLPVTS